MRAMSSSGWSAIMVTVVLAVPFGAVRAQTGRGTVSPSDSAQLAQRRANAMKILSPARFALEKRTELALEAPQIAALQKLAVALDDSGSARRNRAQTAAQARNPATSVTAKAAASWTGVIDEAGIRGDYCQQSEGQADAMIGLVRDRHMVGAVLTAAQRTRLEEIFAASVNPPVRK
ncbi:MAG: hypothetical protein ABJE47_09590 [bacterium]